MNLFDLAIVGALWFASALVLAVAIGPLLRASREREAGAGRHWRVGPHGSTEVD